MRVKGTKKGDILESTFNGKLKKSINNLKSSKILILISIKGNEYCAGEYLQASITEALTSHGEVTLLIADEVYWNNLASDVPCDIEETNRLKSQARQLGAEFIAENLLNIVTPLGLAETYQHVNAKDWDADQLVKWINTISRKNGLTFNMMRWVDWTTNPHSTFSQHQPQLENLMSTHPQLIASVELEAKKFASRHSKEHQDSLWLQRSRQYLREETPAIIWLAAQLGYEFIAYPGEVIAPFVAAKKLWVDSPATEVADSLQVISKRPLSIWLEIFFRRRQSKEQLLAESLTSLRTSTSPGFFNAGKADQDQIILDMSYQFLNAPMDPQLKIDLLMNMIATIKQNLGKPNDLTVGTR